MASTFASTNGWSASSSSEPGAGSSFAPRLNGDVEVDVVVAEIGIEPPNADLAKSSGLIVGSGIIVNEMLRTHDPDVYAAGDVANFPCRALQKRLRFEHEDDAAATGRIAGHNMAGRSEPYRRLPFFYSDLFDLGYEAVGEIDSRMEVVEDWLQKYHKGVIYYLADNRGFEEFSCGTFGVCWTRRET